ncbi:tetratricopeptide repeat protein [Sediminibacterium roseum]|uniref:tetratricopeptide repeat protein n=1 Tax=Sediminibacterium roseum TaxID=1978412 RepID=UPI00293BF9D7|nr:tetratricopeptide repeat protein [Sediminibacterium roseum]
MPETGQAQHDDHQSISFDDLLKQAKTRISPEQNERLLKLENSVKRGDVKEQQLHLYHQLARFWYDSVRLFEPYAYYTGEAAKLENSEKSLTFAAHQFLDRMMDARDPALQNWLATNAKVLFEKALALNPANDSSRIGLGACYLFGNISENPMQGILPVREIAEKHPDNLFAQKILALGGKKSGQFDKAIERFKIIVQKDPGNLEALFNLAECYEEKGDNANAVKWYEQVRKLVVVPEAQKEIDKRITELKK